MTSTASLPETCKAVVLSSAGHRFALPLNAISRIVHRAMLQRDRTLKGLFYLENQPLNVVDLTELLPQSNSQSNPEAAFFVIAQLGDKQGGIAAEMPPVLMDLPIQTLHPIPVSYQQQLQGLASHMVSLERGERMDSIFLLDLQKVTTLMQVNLNSMKETSVVTLL